MATVPVEITWTTGQVVTAAQLNSNVRDAINFLIARPLALLRQSVAQAVATGVFTDITMDVEDFDRDNGHSTVTNTARYVSQTAGYYTHSGLVGWVGNNAGRRASRWAVNGTVVPCTDQISLGTSASAIGVAPATRVFFLNVNDFSTLQGFQDTGVSVNTSVVAGDQSGSSILWESS